MTGRADITAAIQTGTLTARPIRQRRRPGGRAIAADSEGPWLRSGDPPPQSSGCESTPRSISSHPHCRPSSRESEHTPDGLGPVADASREKPPCQLPRIDETWHTNTCHPLLYLLNCLPNCGLQHRVFSGLSDSLRANRNGFCGPRGGSHPHPVRRGRARWVPQTSFGRGVQIGRRRGWQISPEPAGTGRASRTGEAAARPHANAEGPRRGSRYPVAGGEVCGRSGWGDARPQPVTRGDGNTKCLTQ
jgi:hypothetical protein